MGFFEALSDHGDAVEDDVVVAESPEEAAGTMPLLLLAPGSKRQRLQITQRCTVEFLENVAMTTIVETAKSLLSLIFGMSSLIFCSKRIPGHRTHRSLYPMQKVAFQ